MKNITTILIFVLSTLTLHSQSFSVFDIDTVSFPVMKAKFYAFDENYKQLLDLSLDDFEIYEDGVEREVLSVSCPEPVPPTAISSVLTMDISGSMSGYMLEKAQEAARSWVNGLPLGKSECAITTFDTKNNMLQDFTKDRNRLLQKIELLGAGGGTDYEAGFINPLSGGLLAAQSGKYKKVLIFLTDGRPNFTPDVSAIVAEAQKYGITIFAVTLDMSCPQCLWDIAAQTGGNCFENVSTVEEAREIYMKILQAAQGGGACEIEWKSGYKCTSTYRELETTITTLDLDYVTNYKVPIEYIAKLQYNPYGIYFQNKEPGIKHDTSLIVKAINADFVVSNITSSNPDFEITPTFFTLNKGDSTNLIISFTPSDSGYTYSYFNFINNICETKYYSSGGFSGIKPKISTLKLTHPNGGEDFLVRSDTIITWEGIAQDEKVKLELSTNNGITWRVISDTAKGLKYNWQDIPTPSSDNCLIKVQQFEDENMMDLTSEILWEKNYGGSDWEALTDIVAMKDNTYVLFGQTRSSDGDISNRKGDFDFWIVHVDSNGNIIWEKAIGGSRSETSASIISTNDNGLLIIGYTASNDGDVCGNHGNSDIWLIKMDSEGNVLRKKTFGGSNFDVASSILQLKDDNIIIAGGTKSDDGDVSINKGDSDCWIIKLDPYFNLIWEKTFGGSDYDKASSIIQTLDDGFIVSGVSSSKDGDLPENKGKTDYWIFKINAAGVLEWSKTFGGSLDDQASDIIQTYDGGYIVTGSTSSNDGDVDSVFKKLKIWNIKLTATGEVEWKKIDEFDWSFSIENTNDGCYLISGYTNINNYKGSCDYCVYKIDINGDILWQRLLGGSKQDVAYSALQTIDGGYIVAGYSQSSDIDVSANYGTADYWVVKLPPEGKVLQEDLSDSLFSIVMPNITSIDIDMGKVQVGQTKDSVVTEFITNIGTWDCRIDSIYFRGMDASAFTLVSGSPQYILNTGASHFAELCFKPSKVGQHNAAIQIISQANTVIQNIQGEGIEPKLSVMCDIIDFGQVYLKEHKDTIKAIIENTGTASIEITKTEITGPDIGQFEIIDGGGSFTLNPGDERELTLRFKPEYLGKTSTNLNFYHKETGSPALTQLYGEGIKQERDCDSTGFEYPDFLGVDDIILSGSTGRVDDFIRLTYANTSQAGAIWHEKPVPVGNGFITEFSFRMSSGNNENTDDGSLPGADGLAFVIQNNENIETGLYGGGIGYHGIGNALAVEFDLFQNNSKQIIDFKDPNGNHVAIQKRFGDKLSALHNANNTIEINEDIPELKSDGTIYYAKIEYNIEPNVMSVYLDDTGVLDDPIIVAGGVKLHDIVNLLHDQRAFVGITSATGNAYQIHDLLDWYFCPFPVDITAVESNETEDDIKLYIYPNPVTESTTIEFNNPDYQFISLSILDIFGREVQNLYSGYKEAGSITFNWDTNGVGDAVYFCRLSLGGENIVKAVVVNK